MTLLSQQTILLNHINGLDDEQVETIRAMLDERVHDAKEAEGMSCAPSQEDVNADDDEHLAVYSNQASDINNQGIDAQIEYLVSLGQFDMLCFALQIPVTDPSLPPAEEFSDLWVQSVFYNTNFGTLINNNPSLQRGQLAKTLRDQMRGFWSGHTAYHLAIGNGLLVDGPKGTLKVLTDKGRRFMDYMRPQLPADFM